MDVFFIDWIHLGDANDNFGSKADNHLKVNFSKPQGSSFCEIKISCGAYFFMDTVSQQN